MFVVKFKKARDRWIRPQPQHAAIFDSSKIVTITIRRSPFVFEAAICQWELRRRMSFALVNCNVVCTALAQGRARQANRRRCRCLNDVVYWVGYKYSRV